MENLLIRKAERQDLPVIMELLKELDLEGDEAMSLEEVHRLFNRISQYPDYHIYLATKGGEPVGTYTLLIMDKLEHGGTPSGIVDSVAVASDRQGEGIGKALMQHAKDTCQEKGCYKIMLSSNKTRTDAHRFYEALGYEQHGISYSLNITE